MPSAPQWRFFTNRNQVAWSFCSQCLVKVWKFQYGPFLQNFIILSLCCGSQIADLERKKGLSLIFHYKIFIFSQRHLQKICWKACNLEQIDFQVHRLLFHPENCYLEGFNLYFLYSKLHIFYKYIRMVWWNVVQDSAGMRITLQQPHYWWVTLGTLNISRVKYSCVA